jgi:GDPmannose 4,6-dehydratase
MYACNGILFNHESPQRGENFVTRKITRAVAKIALGIQDTLYLGNLDAQRDWGHARDYIEGMWLMLQQEKPEDFVLATGITTTIREFVKMAFLEVGIELLFEGLNENEIAKVVACKGKHMLPIGQVVLKVNTDYYRPTEVELLIGDASKAYNKLGWKPTYTLLEIVKEMVASDLILFQKKQVLKDKGFNVENNFE